MYGHVPAARGDGGGGADAWTRASPRQHGPPTVTTVVGPVPLTRFPKQALAFSSSRETNGIVLDHPAAGRGSSRRGWGRVRHPREQGNGGLFPFLSGLQCCSLGHFLWVIFFHAGLAGTGSHGFNWNRSIGDWEAWPRAQIGLFLAGGPEVYGVWKSFAGLDTLARDTGSMLSTAGAWMFDISEAEPKFFESTPLDPRGIGSDPSGHRQHGVVDGILGRAFHLTSLSCKVQRSLHRALIVMHSFLVSTSSYKMAVFNVASKVTSTTWSPVQECPANFIPSSINPRTT